jgi:excisionase family DNA binding protein
MDLSTKKLLNIDEVCDLTGYAKAYLYRLTSSGKIPCSKPGGGKIFFETSKLEQWILRNSNTEETTITSPK